MLLVYFESVFALLYPGICVFNHRSWKLPYLAFLVSVCSERFCESKPTACVQCSQPNLNFAPENGICHSSKQFLMELLVKVNVKEIPAFQYSLSLITY